MCELVWGEPGTWKFLKKIKSMGSEKTPLYEYGFTRYNTVTVLLQCEEIGKATFSKASEV